jgi:import inner membrane translocase subunit TIM54
MIYDYFTERYRVREGAELAWALIQGETRPFVGPSQSGADAILADAASTASTSDTLTGGKSSGTTSDLDFDRPAEAWYQKDFSSLPSRFTKAREDYYAELANRLESIRALAAGERELTKEEAKSTKPLPTEDDLQKERLKKELRWKGMEEGWGIVKQDKEAVWDPMFEGWLRVFKKEGE